MKKVSMEVLAPAGSMESMKAAVAAGADAVYMGGSRFGARAYADNPDQDRLLEAIDYVHLHGRRLYLAVNTLMKEKELEELPGYLAPYYEKGLDGAIVQDLGALACIKAHFPLLPIHASTQMTITGAYGAKALAKLGAARIVTARELSLEEIARIHGQVDVEIESFVHGALCYSYSGQCLFSSLIGGRSGNRGRCAQTCRLPYEVKGQKGEGVAQEGPYALSLKDLCALDLIPDLAQAGVYSLKIEGRMKSPRYTGGVVSVYRKYVDMYLERGKEGYQVDPSDRKLLLQLFDRGGFTDGYYKRQNGRDMVVWKEKPGFREGSQALQDYLDKTYVEAVVQEPVTGRIRLEPGKKAVLELESGKAKVALEGDVVQSAVKQSMTKAGVGKQMGKTGNTPFAFESLNVEIEGDVFLPVQSLNELRRRGLDMLRDKILGPYGRLGEAERDGPALCPAKAGARVLAGKETRPVRLHASLERPDGFGVLLEHPDICRIYLEGPEFSPESWREKVESCHQAGKECMLAMPRVFRAKAERFFRRWEKQLGEAGFDGALVRSMEEPGFLREVDAGLPLVFDYGMYAMNGLAMAMMYQLGASQLTYPLELNCHELAALGGGLELVAYGRLPMMVTAQCMGRDLGGCKPGTLLLKDRIGKEFPVKNNCAFCYNTIYNSSPLWLPGMEKQVEGIAPASLRLQFTLEPPGQVAQVAQAYGDCFLRGMANGSQPRDFTRGHMKRGVE